MGVPYQRPSIVCSSPSISVSNLRVRVINKQMPSKQIRLSSSTAGQVQLWLIDVSMDQLLERSSFNYCSVESWNITAGIDLKFKVFDNRGLCLRMRDELCQSERFIIEAELLVKQSV